MSQELIGQISPEEIEKFKKENPTGIYAVEADGHISYFKKPNRHVLNAAMSVVTKEAPLEYFKSILLDTQIAGSNEYLENDLLFMEYVKPMEEIISFDKGKLVKL